jgi:hypothetical protein
MMDDLEAAQAIASIANECCYRSDGWEEHIAETALKTIRSIRTNKLQHREDIIKIATDYLANNAAESGADELIRELLKSATALQGITQIIAEMWFEVDGDPAIPVGDIQWKKGYKQACSDIATLMQTGD